MDTELGFVYTETGIVYKSDSFSKIEDVKLIKNIFINNYKNGFGW